MNVVWHDNEGICIDINVMIGDFIPAMLHDLSKFIQLHLFILNTTEQALMFVCADHYEIRA